MVEHEIVHFYISGIAALLHDVTVAADKSGVKGRMGLHGGGKSLTETVKIGVRLDFYNHRYVILQGIAILFPIDKDTALILGDGIVFLNGYRFFFRFIAGSGCDRINQATYSRVGHRFLRGDAHVLALCDSGHKPHCQQRGQSHSQQIGRHTE